MHDVKLLCLMTAAGRAGELEQVLALSAIQYMSAERDYVPWHSLALNMGYVRRMLITGAGSDLLKVPCLSSVTDLSDQTQIGAGDLRYVNRCSFASQTYMQSLLRGVVADVGYVDSDSDGHLER